MSIDNNRSPQWLLLINTGSGEEERAAAPRSNVAPFQQAVLIYNPTAGRPRERARAVVALVAQAAARGLVIEVRPTDHPGHATELATAAVGASVDLVIAYGGDGTVNEILQSLVGTKTALAVWPGGTANVLALELGMPKDPAAMARRLVRGTVKQVSLGRAGDRYFVLMAGIGLDASVTAGVRPDLKRRLGKGAFALSAWQHLIRWRPPQLTVRWLDDHPPTAGSFVVVGNTAGYGGGFRLTPGANLEDPYLEVCVISWPRRRRLLALLLPMYLGRHLRLPGVVVRKVASVEVLGDAPVQLDGELHGHSPLRLEAIPQALTLLV